MVQTRAKWSGWKRVLGPKAASVVPLGIWDGLCDHPVLLPYYHMVSDESVPHLRHLYRYKNTARFEADLDFFLSHGQPISLEDLLGNLYRGRPLPQRSFLVSFDDGFREMAEVVAPLLKAKGVPAVFFVNSAFVDNRELCFHHQVSLLVERVLANPGSALLRKLAAILKEPTGTAAGLAARLKKISYPERLILGELAAPCEVNFERFLAEQRPYLSSPQIRELIRDGFSIGGHSVDHPFYGDLSLDEQLRQTRESLHFLQRQFRVKQKAFAFPHSDAGVSREFFDRLAGDGSVITFGTAGLLPDDRPAHFQRFSMEKSDGSARQVLAWQMARFFYRDSGHRSAARRKRKAAKSEELFWA